MEDTLSVAPWKSGLTLLALCLCWLCEEEFEFEEGEQCQSRKRSDSWAYGSFEITVTSHHICGLLVLRGAICFSLTEVRRYFI
jgi:hypothetical protein